MKGQMGHLIEDESWNEVFENEYWKETEED